MLPRSNESRATTGGLYLSLLLTITLLIAACGGDHAESVAVAATDLQTEQVAFTTLPVVHPAIATVRARTTSPLASRLLGNVVAIHVREGDRVRRGDLLLELDAREVSAGLQKASAGIDEIDRAIAAAEAGSQGAQANRTLATSTYERFKVLRDRRSVSPQEFEEVEARYRAAIADADRAAETLSALRAKRGQVEADTSSAQTFASYARITSPIDGIVASKSVELGMQVAPGMLLMVIDDDRSFEAEVAVEESISSSVKAGDVVALHIPALALTLEGRVARVVPALDPSTRTSIIRIDLPPDPRLRSGLYAEARIPVGERKGIAVPLQALVRRGQLESVFVAGTDGIVRLRLVRAGRADASRVEILSGLDAGERVVVNAGSAKEGTKIGEGA